MIQADLDVVQLSLQTLQMDLNAGAPKTTIRQDIQALDQSLVQLNRDEARFRVDTFADLGIGHNDKHDAAMELIDLTALRLDNDFAPLSKLP